MLLYTALCVTVLCQLLKLNDDDDDTMQRTQFGHIQEYSPR